MNTVYRANRKQIINQNSEMKIIYFGKIADITKKPFEEVVLQNNTLQELIDYLNLKYQIDIGDMQFAVNYNLVSKSDNLTLISTDEVAILSAFAGG